MTIVFSGKYRWAVSTFWAVETLALVYSTWLTFLQLGTIVFALYESYSTENYVPIGTATDLPCPHCGKVAPYPSVEYWVRRPRSCPHCKYRWITGSAPIRLQCCCGHAELETFDFFKVSEYFGFCGSCSQPWFIRRHDSLISAFFCETCRKIDLREKNDSDYFGGDASHDSGHFVREIEPSNELLALYFRMGRIRSIYYRNLIRKYTYGSHFPKIWKLLVPVFKVRTVAIFLVLTAATIGTRSYFESKSNIPTPFEKCGSPKGFETAEFNVNKAVTKLSSGHKTSGKFACLDLRNFTFLPGEYGELEFYNVKFGNLVLKDLKVKNLVIKESEIRGIRITRTKIERGIVITRSNPHSLLIDSSIANSLEISEFTDMTIRLSRSKFQIFEVANGGKMQFVMRRSLIQSLGISVQDISTLNVAESSFCRFGISRAKIRHLQLTDNRLADPNGAICESRLYFSDIYVFDGNIDFLQFDSLVISDSNVSRLDMQKVYGDEIFVYSSLFAPPPNSPTFVTENPEGVDSARCVGCVLFNWPTTTSSSSSTTEFIPRLTSTTVPSSYVYDGPDDCELPDFVYDEEGNRSIRCN